MTDTTSRPPVAAPAARTWAETSFDGPDCFPRSGTADPACQARCTEAAPAVARRLVGAPVAADTVAPAAIGIKATNRTAASARMTCFHPPYDFVGLSSRAFARNFCPYCQYPCLFRPTTLLKASSAGPGLSGRTLIAAEAQGSAPAGQPRGARPSASCTRRTCWSGRWRWRPAHRHIWDAADQICWSTAHTLGKCLRARCRGRRPLLQSV